MTSDFVVLPRTESHLGKTYEQWLEDWGKWFVKNNRDEINKDLSKGYVMLRGQPRGYLQQKNWKDDSYFEPLVIPLKIKSDTLVFFPIICTISSKEWEPDPSSVDTDEKLKLDARKHNDPSLSSNLILKVNGSEVLSGDQWNDYYVNTDIFDLEVDSGDWNDHEGPQSKIIDTIELKPGPAKAVIYGACILGKFSANTDPYILRIRGTGARNYEVHAIYVIQVD
jgi:hypothetical protein